jgi:ribonuclease HII
MSRWIAGVDEAGRGPLAGPVFAAAVVLHPRRSVPGLADSKLLEPAERARLALLIRRRAVAWAVAWADAEEIDSLNILQATFLAMRRAVCGLGLSPARVLVDGNRLPRLADLCGGAEAIVGGDARVAAISAASILAKQERDSLMERLDERYPGYGLAVHKGYPTPLHLQCLRRAGPSVLHRRSFQPVRALTGEVA